MLRKTLLMGALALVCAAPLALAQNSLTLSDAIKLALANNPGNAASARDASTAAINARGARALTNPIITLNPNIAGSNPAEDAIDIVQPLEVNGSRKARTQAAQGEFTAASAVAAVSCNDLVRDVKLAYWQIALAQSNVELNEDNVRFAEAMNDAAKRQVEVGAAPGSRAIKTELELTRARQDLVKANSDLTLAKSTLNNLLGRAPSCDIAIADKLTYSPVQVDATMLCTLAQSKRPEILESQGKLASSRAAVDAAKAARRPDLAVQANKEKFSGGSAGLGLGITLPILDWGGAKATQRSAEVSVSSAELRAASVKNNVALEVQNAATKVLSADKLVRDYENGILNQSQQLADMAQKGYKAGATNYLEVLEAQRTLRDVKTGYYSALAELWSAKAELEWATASEVK